MAFWFADTKSPYVAGGLGSANLLATTVGATNVFSDTVEDWPAVGWETLVDRDPDVLVLGDLARNRFPGDLLADKIAFLESDPVTSMMAAVRGNRYIALHGAEMNPSIRSVNSFISIDARIAAATSAVGKTLCSLPMRSPMCRARAITSRRDSGSKFWSATGVPNVTNARDW